MNDEYKSLYIDSKQVGVYSFKDNKLCEENFTWEGDFVKLDDILEERKSCLNKVFLTFDGEIDIYEQLHMVDLLQSKQINVVKITHRFVSFLLSYIYYLWEREKKEVCGFDRKKNCLIIEVLESRLDIGVVSFRNSSKELTWKMMGLSSFSKTDRLVGYENDQLLEKSIIKRCIEEFYIENKHELREVFIDDLVFVGDFDSFKGLTENILSLFNKKEGIFIREKGYGGLGALLDGLTDLGQAIPPFRKDNIAYVGEDLFLYQTLDGQVTGERVLLVSGSDICPVQAEKSIIISNAMKNPVTFTVAKKEGGDLKEMDSICLYLPFHYWGDKVSISFYINEKKKVKLKMVHDRTQETVAQEFEL